MDSVKVRTINGAVRAIREVDPDSAVTATLLRRLCKSGNLPYLADGNRMLVRMDDVWDVLSRNLPSHHAAEKGGKPNG